MIEESFVVHNEPLSTLPEFMLMRWAWWAPDSFWMRAGGTRGAHPGIRGLELSAPHPPSSEGSGAGDDIITHDQ